MKKLVLLFAVAMVCTGCPGGDWVYYDAVWYVRNSTGQTISITGPPNTNYTGGDLGHIPSGSGVELQMSSEYEKEPYFGMLLRLWGSWAYENIAFEVRSTDGTLLKTWKYSERDEAGNQFFNETSWEYTSGYDREHESVLNDWYFEITNADLL